MTDPVLEALAQGFETRTRLLDAEAKVEAADRLAGAVEEHEKAKMQGEWAAIMRTFAAMSDARAAYRAA